MSNKKCKTCQKEFVIPVTNQMYNALLDIASISEVWQEPKYVTNELEKVNNLARGALARMLNLRTNA